MIDVRRMDHVSMAVWSVEDQLPFFRDVLGMQVRHHFRSEASGFSGVTLSIPGTNTDFELIEPLGDDSFLRKFLRERGPGLHHITLRVENVAQAAAGLRSHGLEPFPAVPAGKEQGETFIHPRDSGGLLVQIIDHEIGPSE